MLLLQFSTSHYCRKARLALGLKQIRYSIENLTPGAHVLKLKPLTGLTTVPVLLPQQADQPEAIADSTAIFRWLDRHHPTPALGLDEPKLNAEVWAIEDWLDESIGIASRFVYYDYRSSPEGKQVDPSLTSQLLIQLVRQQQQITPVRVQLAEQRLKTAFDFLEQHWNAGSFLVGDRLTAADLAAAALLSPLALIPSYQQAYPWLFQRIAAIHEQCGETLPPGLT